jgi:glycosyltransferase involved in cell wall biosynthesis
MTASDCNLVSAKKERRRRIRILNLVTSLEPGGLENGVVNLANGLDPSRFHTTIVCLERVGDFAARLRNDVKLICLDKPPGFRFSAARKLADTIRSERSDIIHTHNLGPLIYGSLARMLVGRGVAVLQGEHGQLRPAEMTAKRKWLRRMGYRICRGVHAVSASLREDLINHGFDGEKIKVVLNGVDCERFTPVSGEHRTMLRSGWGMEEDSIVIGIVGRFVALKGHTRLIEAFGKLASNHPRLRLLIVGDHGAEREKILRQIEGSPVRRQIVWSGYQQETVDFYRMMDLLVVPSDSEGLSNVMLEAMACGVPCLAHPACGASEVIVDGNNGLLRKMATPCALAAALGGIAFDESLLRTLGENARQTAEHRFSLATMVTGYSQLYEEILGELSEPGKPPFIPQS